VDGVLYFVREILPLIRLRRPGTNLVIAGRDPAPEIRALGNDAGITVTGTVPDIRRYLWGAKISIVPLRIGGGTRLKIYEAMASRTPTVSTRIGAEGIPAEHPVTIRLADEPADFAQQCLELLDDDYVRIEMAEKAWDMVDQNYSWETVARQFEDLLDEAYEPRSKPQ
jgi:glycosyltransferase involved in cell wall biosynthesis